MIRLKKKGKGVIFYLIVFMEKLIMTLSKGAMEKIDFMAVLVMTPYREDQVMMKFIAGVEMITF